LVSGVYVAWASFPATNKPFLTVDKKYKCALSIGWNPVFDNNEKTVEAYIIYDFEEDFYGEELKIELQSFLRAEALFDDFDFLIQAI